MKRSLHCFSFFGQIESANDKIHNTSIFKIDNRLCNSALELQDESLLAKFSAGDMVAQDVVYHSLCLVAIYNKIDRFSKAPDIESINECNPWNWPGRTCVMHQGCHGGSLSLVKD